MVGDIILCYGTGWISKLIKFATKSKISHVGVMISEDLMAESYWWGVRLTRLDNKKYDYIILRCDDVTYFKSEKLIDFMFKHIDAEYDYRLFFTLGLNRLFGLNLKGNDPMKFICSELVVAAYKEAGIDLLEGVKSDNVTPHEILNSNKLKVIS